MIEVMREIELKFQVPPGRGSAVDAAVAGRSGAPRMRLQAAYYDTVDRALAAAGLALRVRREGRRWVQTLKGAGPDGLTRAEHNVQLPATHDAAAPADPALHAGTPVGDRLIDLLAGHATPALVCLYRTDIRRRSRELRTRLGMVELAFDEGSIVAGDRRLAVCELEIELLRGSPLAVMAVARQWVARHGLWLDTRSKAERGDLLSRGEPQASPRKAQDVHLDPTMNAGEALRCVLLSCLDQIAVNASQVASGDHEAEHVHQLRIGLRRLRTALRLFDATFADPAREAGLAEAAAALFRGLGVARDRVAIAEPMERELSAALDAAGLRFAAPTLPLPPDAIEPAPLVRGTPAQALLLTLFELTQAEPMAASADDVSIRDQLTRRLRRWHRKAAADAGRFATLDDAQRHLLRKRVKRLRYGIEFASDLFERKRVRRYVKPLRALQERLGALVDLTISLDAYRHSSDDDAHALFAVGWLASRREQLLRDSVDDIAAFAEVKAFWKKG
jgi:inorganic triphosphatase YgiF